MEIKIEYDKKHWYTAIIEELWIVTEWNNFDELLKNISEAIECYYETNEKKLSESLQKAKFYLSFENNANILQTNY